MINNVFKIILMAVLLGVSPLAHAIQLGEYSATPFDQNRKNKAFNICIQSEGNWYMSSGLNKGWRGKWSKASKGGYILQAISTRQKRMKSFSVNSSLSFGYYQEVTTSGSSNFMEMEMAYKGACGSQKGRKSHVKKAVAKNPYTMREKPNVGLWRLAAVYNHGKFEVCAAALPSRAGHLVISRNASTDDNKAWRVEVPPLVQFKRGMRVQIQEQLGNMKAKRVMVDVDPNDGGLSHAVSLAWIADFFSMAENESYYTNGIVRDTYQVGMGKGFATKMKWKLSSQEDVLMAIDACVQESK